MIWRTKRGEDVDPGYYIGSVWNLLQTTINFTANYCIPEDNSSGSKMNNGSWSGVIGMMQKGELAISNIPLVMTPSRATVVNFTFPLLSIRYNNSVTRHTYPMKNAAIIILFATTYLSAVVLLATYNAAFTSQFTVPRPWMPFTTFWDFLQDKSYKLGVMPNTAQASYFEHTNDPLLNRIYDKKVVPYRSSLPRDDIEGLERLCSWDEYALATNTYNLISMDFSPNCTITPVPQAFIPASIAIATSKDSPYRGIFNYKLETLRARGILQRLYKKQWKNVYEEKGTLDMAVTFQEIAPVLIVLMTGIIAGIIFLLIEIIVYHFQEKYTSYAIHVDRESIKQRHQPLIHI
ncbi:hypothetical protein C0J52_06805 [Blattella germanica]|nr:hypothetical protein C0J52_06805 [Blattella germanica]